MTMINMISSANNFQRKSQLLSTNLQCQDYFESMHAELQRQGEDSVQQVRSIVSKFARGFTDFGSMEPVIHLFPVWHGHRRR